MSNMSKHVLDAGLEFPLSNDSLHEAKVGLGEVYGRRRALHELLVSILGSRNVYFQPPESVKISYPCIVYKRDDIKSDFANNKMYNNTKRYQVTVIDKNPDSVIPDKILELPLCKFDRHYTMDNLNHDVFNLYY